MIKVTLDRGIHYVKAEWLYETEAAAYGHARSLAVLHNGEYAKQLNGDYVVDAVNQFYGEYE